jgi:hypothetical protein
MAYTIDFLKKKERRLLAASIGAGVGAAAGAFVGTPAGLVTRAYQSGAGV